MNRRYFFGRAGWAAAFLGGLGVFGFQAMPVAADGMDEARSRLLDALPSRPHAVTIGKAHLAAQGERPDARTLVSDITSCIGMSDAEVRRCAAPDLRAALSVRTASDFAAGRTVRVGGWVLGATEARLFSLAALA